MPIPQTSTYLPNRARIVQLALTNVGAIGPGAVTPSQDSAPLVAYANDVLNILVKSMDVDGILPWRTQRRTLTSIAGQAAYVLPNDTNSIDQPGRYTVAGQTAGTLVMPIVTSEYQSLGDRTLQGTPIQYWLYENLDATTGLRSITLYFFPVPINTGDTFEYMSVVRARDQSTDADTLDVPQEWIRCLVYLLSADLAPGFGLPADRLNFFATQGENERQRCLEQATEHADVQIVAWGDQSYGWTGRGNYR